MSLENHLTESGYKIISVGTKVNEVDNVKEKIDAIIIYADTELLDKKQALSLLQDKAIENSTPFFIVGDLNELESIRELIPKHLIVKEYQHI